MRKRINIGLMAAAMLLLAAYHPAYSDLVSSAQRFQRQYVELGHRGTALNPVERLVFSLLMSQSSTAPKTTTLRATAQSL
jgi:hypothetical protein